MLAVVNQSNLAVAVGFHLLVLVLLAIAVVLCFRRQLWLPLLALFLGLLIGFIDLLSREPQLPALMLLAAGFFVAYAQPRHAWRWALLIGIWVPAGGLIRWALKTPAAEPTVHPAAGLLALAPALLGAYGGALAAWAGRHRQSPAMQAEPLT